MNIEISSYKVEWLASIETQRANKFYRKFHFRGKVKSNDRCVVIKNQAKEIVASGFIRSYQDFNLLSGVAVMPHLQRAGIGKMLLEELSTRFSNSTYTFPYSQLVELYQQLGFELVDPKLVFGPVNNLFCRYLNQGRDIKVMRYSV